MSTATAIDPSKPLDTMRERFLKRLMLGDSATEAYRKGHPKASARVCENEGSLLRKEREVAMRYEWMQKQVEAETFLTVAEKRNFLALAVRTPIGEIDETHVLCQSLKRKRLAGRDDEDGWEVEEIKAVDKIASIKVDNEMDGSNKAIKHEHAGGVTLSLEDAMKLITHGASA